MVAELSAIKSNSKENSWLICSVPLNPVTTSALSPSGVVTCNSRFVCERAINSVFGCGQPRDLDESSFTCLRSCIIVGKISVFDGHLNFLRRNGLHQPRQQLAADLGQKGLRKNRIHHASAALEFGAPACDQLDHSLIIAETDVTIRPDSLL